MDTKMIKNLIAMFQDSDLSCLDANEEENGKKFSIRLEKNKPPVASEVITQTLVAPTMPQNTMAMSPVPTPLQEVTFKTQDGIVDFNNLSAINSPMVGIYYSSSSPDAEPFVKKGSYVKKGDTLCIIEAMKLMNEVVAEQDGEIIEVCAKNGELVEFGQALFRIL